jgi:peptidoglycan/LPS O-acetylase OafA/YrhL
MQLAANAWLRSARAPQITLYLGHFWSLCVEEQFYLFWPWIVFWVRSRRALIWLCGTIIVVVSISRLTAQQFAPGWMLQGELLYRATPFQLDALFLGGLVALLLRGKHSKRVFEVGRITALYASFLFAFMLAIGVVQSYPNWRFGYPYPAWKFTWGLTLVDLLSASIMVGALAPTSFIYRALNLRPLRWLGRISYGAYVFHDIFHGVFLYLVLAEANRFHFVADHAELLVVLLGLSCTLVISWLSFRLYESRFLRLKERWTMPTDRTVLRERLSD